MVVLMNLNSVVDSCSAGELTGFGDPKGHGPMDYCLPAVIDHVFMWDCRRCDWWSGRTEALAGEGPSKRAANGVELAAGQRVHVLPLHVQAWGLQEGRHLCFSNTAEDREVSVQR